MPVKTAITHFQLAEMVAMIRSGEPLIAISQHFGMAEKTLGHFARPIVALIRHYDPDCPGAHQQRVIITQEQLSIIRARLDTDTTLIDIADEMGIHRCTVYRRAKPMIAEMKAAGTLGKCECGADRFHGKCPLRLGPGTHSISEEHLAKREAIKRAILTGETYAVIAKQWSMTASNIQKYVVHLTPAERDRRLALQRARSPKHQPEPVRPAFSDDIYSAISAAVPRWVSPALRDDVISDMYVALLENEITFEQIADEAGAYSTRAVADFESRFGPLSLDESRFEGGGETFRDTVEDESALDAFDRILESDEIWDG